MRVTVAACSTAGQGSGGLGESASQTVQDQPQTAVGAGVGAAGGAAVGGLAGGTKGAVIGGLMGVFAGGAVGTTWSDGKPPFRSRRLAPHQPRRRGRPLPVAAAPRVNPNGAALVRVDEVQAEPAQL